MRLMATDHVEGMEPGGLVYQCSAEAWQPDGRWAQWVGQGDTYEQAVERAMYLAQAPHQEPPAPSQWIPYDARPKVKRKIRRGPVA